MDRLRVALRAESLLRCLTVRTQNFPRTGLWSCLLFGVVILRARDSFVMAFALHGLRFRRERGRLTLSDLRRVRLRCGCGAWLRPGSPCFVVLPLFCVVMLRGYDFFNFARNSMLKRIDLHGENRAFRNKVTLSERAFPSGPTRVARRVEGSLFGVCNVSGCSPPRLLSRYPLAYLRP